MKPNPSLDELLCSFMDGELSPRQQVEVQRMATRDPQVAQRLRQLQNCRALFSSLPQAQAPADLLDQIKVALERRTLLQEQPVLARRSFGAWHLVFRRFAAAAAMIALLAVLGLVVYQIVAPVSNTGPLSPIANPAYPPALPAGGVAAPPVLVADAGFSGRLELQTATPVQVDAFIRRAIEDHGLSPFVDIDTTGGTHVYRLVSTREGVNRLLTSLGGIWQNFEDATLAVDRPGTDSTPVVVQAVAPEQAVSIVARDSTEASVAAAESCAVLNEVARGMPGRSVLALIEDDAGPASVLRTVPQPIEASNDKNSKTTLAPPQGGVEASLTIILLGTK